MTRSGFLGFWFGICRALAPWCLQFVGGPDTATDDDDGHAFAESGAS